uniref:Uncharacterized protein LOC114325958 n=1 Tax=Diabrotica virgifera virgifera TaxID=50390 RepID=A0A6P7F8X6_DIAVI
MKNFEKTVVIISNCNTIFRRLVRNFYESPVFTSYKKSLGSYCLYFDFGCFSNKKFRMSNTKFLSAKQLEEEAARIMMNGEESDPEPFEDSGSDWEENNLEA